MSQSDKDMALVAHAQQHPSSFGGHCPYFNRTTRRNSDMSSAMEVNRSSSASSAPVEGRRPISTLEDIAAEIQRLSTSPTGAFTYLDGDLYRENNHNQLLFKKSRSLPNIIRDPIKSALSSKPPLRKTKSVRFADSQGLPLVEAVHQLTLKDSSYTANKIVPYDDQEDILSSRPLILGAPSKSPSTPRQSSGNTLSTGSLPRNGSPRNTKRQNSPTKPSINHRHVFAFSQPSLEPDFFDRIKTDYVALESVREEPRSLHGIVRVLNKAYEKEVTIRWTHDNWRSSHETSCVFCSNDGDTDRFAFELPINGDDVSFAIRYRTLDKEYWDNNRGKNYTVLSKL